MRLRVLKDSVSYLAVVAFDAVTVTTDQRQNVLVLSISNSSDSSSIFGHCQ